MFSSLRLFPLISSRGKNSVPVRLSFGLCLTQKTGGLKPKLFLSVVGVFFSVVYQDVSYVQMIFKN